ncbi:RseA family anti-sigma factor [Actinobacillus genomosp. 1]|uniref:sigma-E factor negative regulatory protein n=1 Tax=Actinobacillus genomosp. 1 TaxID=254839 RepID=UPI002443255D|nr:RseA family anti-sigma factor [Actinobacillus genomosp. 1]WGE36447.1 RseA family anti-sigma factor [Actinobacillus genomosp. 1]
MQQNETLSAFMDGQKVDDAFIDDLCDSPELKQKWARYHAVSSILHGDEIILGNDFSAKMEALLENEEIESQSSDKAATVVPQGKLLKLKRWGMPIMQAGIAASVCLVAVLGVNMVNEKNELAQSNQPVLQTQPFSDSVQPVSYNAPSKDVATLEKLESQQHKINALLQAQQLQSKLDVESMDMSKAKEQKEKAQTSATDKKSELEKN